MSGALDFHHQQSAHCESGVMSALLRHEGVPMSEAMVFGLSASLSFAYIPLVKINQLPLIAYRMVPRFILNGVRKKLRLPLRFETFRSPLDGRRRLDELLDQGRLVGLAVIGLLPALFPGQHAFSFQRAQPDHLPPRG